MAEQKHGSSQGAGRKKNEGLREGIPQEGEDMLQGLALAPCIKNSPQRKKTMAYSH